MGGRPGSLRAERVGEPHGSMKFKKGTLSWILFVLVLFKLVQPLGTVCLSVVIN